MTGSVRTRLAAATAALLIFSVASTDLWVLLVRSTIPFELHAVVTRAYIRGNRSGGAEIYLISLDDGREVIVDVNVEETLATGDIIDKEAWSTTLTYRRGTARTVGELSLVDSLELWRLVPLMTIMLALAIGLAAAPRRSDTFVRRTVDRAVGRRIT